MNKLFHHNTILILTFCFLILGVLLNQYHLGENFIIYKHGLIASFFFAVGIFYKNNEKYFLSSMNISFYIYPFISLLTFLVRVTFTATISVTYKTIPFLVLYSITGTLFLLYVSKKLIEILY